MSRVRLTIDGRPTEGEDLAFEPLVENWNEYRVADGSLLRLKTVVGRIVRLEGTTATGEPLYQVISQQVVMVTPPEPR